MPEWSNGAVLKTVSFTARGFESYSLLTPLATKGKQTKKDPTTSDRGQRKKGEEGKTVSKERDRDRVTSCTEPL